MSGSARVGGYAARGASHIRKEMPCQDAWLAQRRTFAHGEALAVAVADGHGSSLYADVGARLAVEVVTERLLAFYDALSPEIRTQLPAVLELALAPTRRQVLQAWAERVGEAASEEVSPELLKEYGATLLAALVTPEFVLFGQLGDGDILQVETDGQVSRPLQKDPRSFADETASLCQKEAWLQMRMAIRPPPSCESLLMLSTDGYGNSYENDAEFERIGPDYLKLVRERGLGSVVELLPSFLEQVSSGGSGDDVTLALIHVAFGGEPGCPPSVELEK